MKRITFLRARLSSKGIWVSEMITTLLIVTENTLLSQAVHLSAVHEIPGPRHRTDDLVGVDLLVEGASRGACEPVTQLPLVHFEHGPPERLSRSVHTRLPSSSSSSRRIISWPSSSCSGSQTNPTFSQTSQLPGRSGSFQTRNRPPCAWVFPVRITSPTSFAITALMVSGFGIRNP